MNTMPWPNDEGTDELVEREAPDHDRLVLGVLSLVEGQGDVTQRGVAKHLGVALGLANSYVKRCVRKGFIKVSQAPARRYRYYLTPQGFAEKSRLTAEYLRSTFQFFGAARNQCTAILRTCVDNGWNRAGVYGAGDLADIFHLLAKEWPLEVLPLPSDPSVSDLSAFDAVVLLDLNSPQASFDMLLARVPAGRLLAPPLLRVRPRREVTS
ncbi:MAG: winged helix-turn-helix transcriptional regulator [Pseudomonadota bacterium]